ncbi:hypothetical protein [Stappia sp.]|uniref:hypothetical protein n=1 Tax=Stappia sp. TaxID=1870903 RepID=UPI003C7AC5E9
MNYVDQIPLSAIDRAIVQPEISAFWKEWRENGGNKALLPDLSESILSRLTVSKGFASEGASPKLLCVGENSFLAECFGKEWSKSAIFEAETPDPELEILASGGYHRAIAGEPNLDLVRVVTRVSEFHYLKLTYERLIMPIKINDTNFITACMTAKLKMTHLLLGQGGQDPQVDCNIDNHPRGYDQAHYSIPFHMD